MKLVQQDTQLPISEVRIEGAPNVEKENNFIRHSKLFGKNIRGLFIGPSGCGKTSALLSLIYNPNGISFKNIYFFLVNHCISPNIKNWV